MLPESSHSVILAFAANPMLAQSLDLSELQPIPVRWVFELSEMIREVDVLKPVSMIVVGDGDNVASMRTCYALRKADSAPLHLISSTMSESEANLARSLGATTVHNAQTAPAIISQFVWQFLKLTAESRVTETPKLIEIAGLRIDLGRRTVCVGSSPVALTRIEFELLTLLVRAAGSVISRAELVAKVWGSNWFGVENVLDTHLAHLRRKIAGNGFDKAIVNVRGVGFYFEPQSSFSASASGVANPS
jgi:DNA-binding response OmpR family regulator